MIPPNSFSPEEIQKAKRLFVEYVLKHPYLELDSPLHHRISLKCGFTGPQSFFEALIDKFLTEPEKLDIGDPLRLLKKLFPELAERSFELSEEEMKELSRFTNRLQVILMDLKNQASPAGREIALSTLLQQRDRLKHFGLGDDISAKLIESLEKDVKSNHGRKSKALYRWKGGDSKLRFLAQILEEEYNLMKGQKAFVELFSGKDVIVKWNGKNWKTLAHLLFRLKEEHIFQPMGNKGYFEFAQAHFQDYSGNSPIVLLRKLSSQIDFQSTENLQAKKVVDQIIKSLLSFRQE